MEVLFEQPTHSCMLWLRDWCLSAVLCEVGAHTKRVLGLSSPTEHLPPLARHLAWADLFLPQSARSSDEGLTRASFGYACELPQAWAYLDVVRAGVEGPLAQPP